MNKFIATFLVWGAVYIVVTAVLVGFRWANLDLPLPVQTFILTAALVPSIVFIIGPAASLLAARVMRRIG